MSDVIHPAKRTRCATRACALHIEDGRQFLQATPKRFDLITGEPPPPRTPGAVNIYTREYFQLMHDRLAEGGIATYWLPVGRPDPGTNVNAIVRAFCDVFADCSLWNATPFDLMLAGTRGTAAVRCPKTSSRAHGRFPPSGRVWRKSDWNCPSRSAPRFSAMPRICANWPARARRWSTTTRTAWIPARHAPRCRIPATAVDPAVTQLYERTCSIRPARQSCFRDVAIRPPRLARTGHRRDASLFRASAVHEPGFLGRGPAGARHREAASAADRNAAAHAASVGDGRRPRQGIDRAACTTMGAAASRTCAE